MSRFDTENQDALLYINTALNEISLSAFQFEKFQGLIAEFIVCQLVRSDESEREAKPVSEYSCLLVITLLEAGGSGGGVRWTNTTLP